MKLVIRSLIILFLLYGLVFAVGDYYLADWNAPVWLALAFVVGLVLFQYLLGPPLIEWLVNIEWLDLDSADRSIRGLPDESVEFIKRLCAERGLRIPRIGMIHSGTPNAFSFGHIPENSRVVVTSGLVEVLTPDELNAVLAHEIGHIEHWDFVVMTFASIVPLVLYQIYAFLRNDKNGRVVAYGAYLAYILSQFIVLALNRTREYFADQYSAQVTKNPALLQSSLVKIACGLVKAEGDYQRVIDDRKADKKQAKEARRQHRLAGTIAVMGISNVYSGASLALAGADPVAAARVMQWDLVNPWARLYELSSTHPLTAFRVKALNAEAAALHQSPSYPLADQEPIRWGAFPLEVFLWAAPGGAAFLLGAAWSMETYLHRFGLNLRIGSWAYVLLFIGITWTLRILYRYRGEVTPQTVGRLIEDLEVSEMRPRAVRLEGQILGRGVPGAFWSPDLVIKDETGLLFVLYRPSIPLARFLFAMTAVDELIGAQVTIEGWFRRGVQPYIEMSRLTLPSGRTHRAYSRWIQLALAAICVAIGLIGLGVL